MDAEEGHEIFSYLVLLDPYRLFGLRTGAPLSLPVARSYVWPLKEVRPLLIGILFAIRADVHVSDTKDRTDVSRVSYDSGH